LRTDRAVRSGPRPRSWHRIGHHALLALPAEKFDTSDKWDASEKSEFDPARKDEQLGSEPEFEEF